MCCFGTGKKMRRRRESESGDKREKIRIQRGNISVQRHVLGCVEAGGCGCRGGGWAWRDRAGDFHDAATCVRACVVGAGTWLFFVAEGGERATLNVDLDLFIHLFYFFLGSHLFPGYLNRGHTQKGSFLPKAPTKNPLLRCLPSIFVARKGSAVRWFHL